MRTINFSPLTRIAGFLQQIILPAFFTLTAHQVISQTENVGRDADGYYLIDSRGNKLSGSYDLIQLGDNSWHLAYKEGKFGYLGSDGKAAIPFEYDIAYHFDGRFALVGRSGKYYYINTANKRLDSLDFPTAPKVYNKRFLVTKKNVYYEDGSVLLSTENEFILAPKSGIIEWNAKDSVATQYASSLLYTEQLLKKIQTASVYSPPVITTQGYVVLPQLEKGIRKFKLYTDSEGPRVNVLADNYAPELITIVWDHYVYIPKVNGYPTTTFGPLGPVTQFLMSDLLIAGLGTKSAYPFYINNSNKNNKIAQLYPMNKWFVFDGSRIIGRYLFDELLPSDEGLLPARIGEDWFIYDYNRDSLRPLPYKRIHPVGMNEGRLFVSSVTDMGINEQIWALVNIRGDVMTKEEYSVPLLTDEQLTSYDSERYEWSWPAEVMSDGRRILLDYKGREVWRDPEGETLKPADLCKINVRFNYGKFTSIDKNQGFAKNQFSVNISQRDSKILVNLVNTTSNATQVLRQDNYIQASLEMKNPQGNWVTIGYLPPSDCGNSYFSGEIPAGKMTSTIIALPDGDTPAVVRVVVKQPNEMNSYVSNEITVNLTGAMSWVDRYYFRYGSPKSER